MQYANKTTWTNHEETMAAHEYFTDIYGPEVDIPMCNFCTKSTCYIIEPARIRRDEKGNVLDVKPLRKGVAMITRMSHLTTLVKDDNIYIPIHMCEQCSARGEAALAFRTDNHNPPNLDTRCFTEEEKMKYRQDFRDKISSLREKLEKEKKDTVQKARNYDI